MPSLVFSNRQRVRSLNTRFLKEITLGVLDGLPRVEDWDLTFYFVSAKRIAEINETHLDHEGATDVITFGYNDPDTPWQIAGEIFICVEVAVEHARQFRTTWQAEVVRYVVHSILHLCGYDDLQSSDRRKMKQVENRLVAKLSKQFKLVEL